MKRTLMTRSNLFCTALCLSVLILAAAPVSASGEQVKIEGEIRGAKCTHFKVECYNDDNHVALEPDFVLVMPNGDYYFMPNLGRAVKARHAYKKVLIHGELRNQELWVDKLVDLEAKGSRTKSTWDWSDRDEFWESR